MIIFHQRRDHVDDFDDDNDGLPDNEDDDDDGDGILYREVGERQSSFDDDKTVFLTDLHFYTGFRLVRA